MADPEEPREPSAPTLPIADRYSMVRELARGGPGRVPIAQNRVLERPVATKELLRPHADARARFAREARITARLDHRSIVPVHDSGAWPTPYYTTKLVSGKTLDAAIGEHPTLVGRWEDDLPKGGDALRKRVADGEPSFSASGARSR